jgi:hypothetical protein
MVISLIPARATAAMTVMIMMKVIIYLLLLSIRIVFVF